MSYQQGYTQPPPPPPHAPRQVQQSAERPYRHERPKSKSGFSFRSHKSDDSAGSSPKLDLHETSKDKARRRLTTKADPSIAINEAEPSTIANDHSSHLAPLRAIQHRDANGMPIVDPDRSNPTRSRWERPLDTIKSFEAAIDGQYDRKYARSNVAESRRSSYHAGVVTVPAPARDPQIAGQVQPYRNGSYANSPSTRADGYYGNNANNNGYLPDRARYPRTGSEPMIYGNGNLNGAGGYPPNGNYQSYETATTVSGSASSGEPPGYHTDPSSGSSSMDRLPPPNPEYSNLSDSYAQSISQSHGDSRLDGYSQQGDYLNSNNAGQQPKGAYQGSGYIAQNAPAPPPKMYNQFNGEPRAPTKLGKGPAAASAERPQADKRKSWFGKRFSKN